MHSFNQAGFTAIVFNHPIPHMPHRTDGEINLNVGIEGF
jgi:hypothetical protein